jgi:hypothetical protein
VQPCHAPATLPPAPPTPWPRLPAPPRPPRYPCASKPSREQNRGLSIPPFRVFRKWLQPRRDFGIYAGKEAFRGGGWGGRRYGRAGRRVVRQPRRNAMPEESRAGEAFRLTGCVTFYSLWSCPGRKSILQADAF